MRHLLGSVALIAGLLFAPVSNAWEANYPSGPVRPSSQPSTNEPNIKIRNPPSPSDADRKALFGVKPHSQEPLLEAHDLTFANLFSRRTVAYPTPDGVDLGHGWDFLLNEKKFISCVQFSTIHDDKYQTVDLILQQTVDEETLDISLNTSFDVSAKATIEVVKASGEAKFSLNASHHMSTSDTTFIAHESATNGVRYAGPLHDGLLLRPDMADLASTDPELFRDRCGDGFVASIGTGADLYVMLHAHDLTTEDKIDLETSAKASAGMGDVFSGSASGSFSTKIDDLIKKHSLDVDFVQQGGIFTTVPTNLDEVKKKVQTFMGEEKEGPRALFITLVPYSDLPNWPGLYLLDTSDMRQRAIRYFQRLQSILYEIRNMRENYFREDGIKGDKYLFDYAHQLRQENLGQTSDDVITEMSHVDDLLKILDGPDCKARPVSAKKPKLADLQNLGNHQEKCEKQVSSEVKNQLQNFNDFRFWIQLPLPLDGVSETDLEYITDVQNTPPHTLAMRQEKFEQSLYRYWVERTDQIRCRLFFECLTQQEQKDEYDYIKGQVPSNPPAPGTFNISVTTELGCAGEKNFDGTTAPNGCRSPYDVNRFTCDQRDYEYDARQLCEVKHDSIPSFDISVQCKRREPVRVRRSEVYLLQCRPCISQWTLGEECAEIFQLHG